MTRASAIAMHLGKARATGREAIEHTKDALLYGWSETDQGMSEKAAFLSAHHARAAQRLAVDMLMSANVSLVCDYPDSYDRREDQRLVDGLVNMARPDA